MEPEGLLLYSQQPAIISWNPKVYCCIHNSQPLFHGTRRFIAVFTTASHYFMEPEGLSLYSQQSAIISWNPKVYRCIHNCQPLFHIQSQLNSVSKLEALHVDKASLNERRGVVVVVSGGVS
jgi:hypothetical protein